MHARIRWDSGAWDGSKCCGHITDRICLEYLRDRIDDVMRLLKGTYAEYCFVMKLLLSLSLLKACNAGKEFVLEGRIQLDPI